MTHAAPARSERARASQALGARILEKVALGVALDAVAQQENLTPREAEKLLRAQLGKGFEPQVEDFARLQIVRLEALIARLGADPSPGTIQSAAVMLKVFERLDRYHGYDAGAAAPVEPTELVKRQIIDKLNRMAAKSLAAGAPSP